MLFKISILIYLARLDSYINDCNLMGLSIINLEHNFIHVSSIVPDLFYVSIFLLEESTATFIGFWF